MIEPMGTRRQFVQSAVAGTALMSGILSELLADSSAAATTIALARLQAALDARNLADRRDYDIRYSVGCIEFDPGRHQDIQQLFADADAAMYVHKQKAGSS